MRFEYEVSVLRMKYPPAKARGDAVHILGSADSHSGRAPIIASVDPRRGDLGQ